jgi:hypothetical protein
MDQATGTSAAGEAAVRALYAELLDAWNRRNSSDFAALFADDARIIGFDGSQVLGTAIEAHLDPIFAGHPTATYVAKIRDIQTLLSGAPNRGGLCFTRTLPLNIMAARTWSTSTPPNYNKFLTRPLLRRPSSDGGRQ